jgi:hypothetical protein
LAQQSLRLGSIPIMHENSGSDGTPVGLYAFQFHLDPIISLAAEIIAQQRGRFIQIDDEDVYIPVVVEVSKSASPATVGRRHSRARLLDEFFKVPPPRLRKTARGVLFGYCGRVRSTSG